MEPRRPPFHVVHVHEEDGETVVDAVSSPICDFCGDIGPTWEYGCKDFQLEGVPSMFAEGMWASMGSWCVCDTCAEMIDKRLFANLIQRSLAATSDHAAMVIQGFFDNMTGEKTPFG